MNANPILNSHHANELELAMKSVFVAMLQVYQDKMNQVASYGVPYLGDDTVIGQFSKLHGLVVLRRGDVSKKLMAIMLNEWLSLASERGLGFLNFVMTMCYPNQYRIVRLYHSKKLADEYPLYLSETASDDKFLTSRVRVHVDERVDRKELSELAPVIKRLVPAHIVLDMAIAVTTDEMSMGVAVGMTGFYHHDFFGGGRGYKHDSTIRHNSKHYYS